MKVKRNKFEQQVLGQFHRDEEFEKYVKAWIAYHDAANSIDGHIEKPMTPEEHDICYKAGRVGMKALEKMRIELGINRFKIDAKKWHMANEMARRTIAERAKENK